MISHMLRDRGEAAAPGGAGKPGYTLHPTPYTLRPTPYTLHPTPYTRHPTLQKLNARLYTLRPEPQCALAYPETPNSKP